ncbi:hypothetical protein [Streptomyces sp. NPDC001292]|uniref:hypothetical protein n=1 Tax=Streptomyces sp. NPDC001292 TaxID=3364558 RepID=UPI00367723E7
MQIGDLPFPVPVIDLTLFEEQAAKWGQLTGLSPSRRAKLRTDIEAPAPATPPEPT